MTFTRARQRLFRIVYFHYRGCSSGVLPRPWLYVLALNLVSHRASGRAYNVGGKF